MYKLCSTTLITHNACYLDLCKTSNKINILDIDILDMSTILQGYDLLKPKEILLPYQSKNKHDTLSLINCMLDRLKYEKLPCTYIGVVQGKNFKEWSECLYHICINADVNTIGIDYMDLLSFQQELGIPNGICTECVAFCTLLQQKLGVNKPIHIFNWEGEETERIRIKKDYKNIVRDFNFYSELVKDKQKVADMDV